MLKRGQVVLMRTLILISLSSWALAFVGCQADEQEVSEAREQAERLLEEGRALIVLGGGENLEQAIATLQEARETAETTGDEDLRARIFKELGAAFGYLGDAPSGLEALQVGVELAREDVDPGLKSAFHNDLGVLYRQVGDLESAERHHLEALRIRKDLKDRAGEASSLSNLGRVYSSQGELFRAMEDYQKSLAIRREIDDQRGAAVSLLNVAGIYDDLMRPMEAIEHLDLAIEAAHEAGHTRAEAVSLDNLAVVYLRLGDPRRALPVLRQALPLREEVGHQPGTATTLHNIGSAYFLMAEEEWTFGDRERAVELAREAECYLQQSLTIREESKDKEGVAHGLQMLGSLKLLIEDAQGALPLLERTLTLRAKTPVERLFTTEALGRALVELGRSGEAQQHLLAGLKAARELGLDHQQAAHLLQLGRIERAEGELRLALEYFGAALEAAESVRSRVAAPGLQMTFSRGMKDYYSHYIATLMEAHQAAPDQGRDVEAFLASERARSRVLNDLLRQTGARMQTGVDPALLDREAEQAARYRSLFARRLDRVNETGISETDLDLELVEALEELEWTKTRIREQNPAFAELSEPARLTLSGVQALLSADDLLLAYYLGAKESYLWIIGRDSLQGIELGARRDLEVRVDELRSVLERTQRLSAGRFHQLARDLSARLLGEIPKDTLAEKRLVIVPDGALHFVPFGVLQNPATGGVYEPILGEHEIVRLPSVTALRELRPATEASRRARGVVAVFADPVFSSDDPRLTRHQPGPQGGAELKEALRDHPAGIAGLAEGFDRLRFSRQEAQAIVDEVGAGSVLLALGTDAIRERLLSAEVQEYPVLHLSTHATVDGSQPRLTAVLLSQWNQEGEPLDGLLTLEDLYNLDLGAELVVLSACQTAGGNLVRGEGLVGMTRGFFFSGARAVIASLWQVDDEATAVLMGWFYHYLASEGLAPAAALMEAQRKMASSPRWSDPYFWAGFTFQGDWAVHPRVAMRSSRYGQ